MEILLLVYTLVGVGYFVGLIKTTNYPNFKDIVVLLVASLFWPILLGLSMIDHKDKRIY